MASNGRWYPPELHPPSDTLVPPEGSPSAQGPGWWLASDGRWYPPQLHPDAIATTAPHLLEPDEPSPAATAGSHDASTRRRRGRPRVRTGAVVVAAVLVTAGSATAVVDNLRGPASAYRSHPAPAVRAEPASKPPALTGWTASSLHVVGGPVVAGGRVVVLASSGNGTVNLVGVNSRTGAVQWQTPFSVSAVWPGAPIDPVAAGAIVLDLAPSGGTTDPAVTLQGVDAADGRVLWADASPTTVVDAPTRCPWGDLFCVVVAGPGGSGQLEEVSATTGAVSASVPGPYRQMTEDLYQTAADPPELDQVVDSTVAWSEPVRQVFGGAQYTPLDGWDFVSAGTLEVGTVAVAPSGTTEALDQLKTVGVAAASGAVQWSVPGALDCFGTLPVDAAYLCRYSAPASYVNGTLSTAGVSLTVEGLDPATGAVTWAVPLADARAMTLGVNVPVADDTHIVVPLASGPALLDLDTGRTTPVPAGQSFWCGRTEQTAVQASAAALSGGKRVTATLYAPCTDRATPTAAVPAHALGPVGVHVAGLFVWPSPTGLQASPVPH